VTVCGISSASAPRAYKPLASRLALQAAPLGVGLTRTARAQPRTRARRLASEQCA
jgi:hypothetical protein